MTSLRGACLLTLVALGSAPAWAQEIATLQDDAVRAPVALVADQVEYDQNTGVVTARGVDPFTGATYGALGNASSKLLVEK